jgi:hypothetical protein
MEILFDHRTVLTEAPSIPVWGLPLLMILGICLVIVITLGVLIATRTRKTKTIAEKAGIEYNGVEAHKSFRINIESDAVVARTPSVVRSTGRFTRMEEGPTGLQVYVRGNFWTWGEVIEVRLTEDAQGTVARATCRPRLKTTLIDYGQNGKDLALFIELVQKSTPIHK